MSSWQHIQTDAPASVLVVLPTWVGDFVMASPFLRALRHRTKNAHTTYLIEPNLQDLVRGCPWMEDCVCWPTKPNRRPWQRDYRRMAAQLRQRKFDWAVLLPNSARSALLAYLIRARRRIGYNRDGRGFLLTDRVPITNKRNGGFEPMPLVDYYADLAQAIGCDRPDDRLELFVPEDCRTSLEQRLVAIGVSAGSPLVVLSPGAKYGAAKCWPADRFAAAADRLIQERGATVMVTCGPGEEPIAQAIQEAMKEKAHALTQPLLSLGQLKALIQRCDLLVCNDAGPRHFAKAFDVPVVTVFGPTHPEWTATRYEDERIVRIDVPCGPCQQRICPLGHVECMTGVTVEMVVNAAHELLDRQTPAAPSER